MTHLNCHMQGLEKENRRKPKNPLYQTIVLDKPTVLRKCHLITEKQSRFVIYCFHFGLEKSWFRMYNIIYTIHYYYCRYLCSKYGRIWLHRTYGRVTPDRARLVATVHVA